MAFTTIPWEPAHSLESREAVASYLEAALNDGHPAVITAAVQSASRSPCVTLGVRAALLAILRRDRGGILDVGRIRDAIEVARSRQRFCP